MQTTYRFFTLIEAHLTTRRNRRNQQLYRLIERGGVGQYRAVITHDHHGWIDVCGLQGSSNGGSLVNVNRGVDVFPVKAHLHNTATKHHAYDRGA